MNNDSRLSEDFEKITALAKTVLNTDSNLNVTDVVSNSTMTFFGPTMTRMAIVVYVVIHPLLIVIGVFGNTLTIETLRRQNKKAASTYLLVGLAISDIMTLLTKSIFVVYRCAVLFGSDIVDDFKVSSFFLLRIPTTPARVGRTFIVTLAVERVIAVWTPLKIHSLSSKRKSILSVILVFVLVVIIDVGSMGQLIESEFRDKARLPAYQQALNSMHTTHKIWKYYRICMAVVFDIIPMVAVIVCNIIIVIGLRTTVKQFGDECNSTFQSRLLQEKKITKMLVVNSIVFFILTAPHCANQLIMDFQLTNTKKDMSSEVVIGLALASLCLETTNYSVNFIIYGVTNKSFRRRYIQVLTCDRYGLIRERNKIESSSTGPSTETDRLNSVKSNRQSGAFERDNSYKSYRHSAECEWNESFKHRRHQASFDKDEMFKNRRYSIKPLLCVRKEQN